MNDREIDDLLKGAAVPPGPNVEMLRRIAESITGSMRPVRPLPPRWVLTGAIALIASVVALAGAALMGFFGIEKMSALQRVVVFPVLGILLLMSANELVSTMIPGSRRRFSCGGLLLMASICWAAVVGLGFRDYETTQFLHAGLKCLGVGLLHAIPAALLSWTVLRRGFAVSGVSAGRAAGIIGGLAGLSMLELHCPNFQATHVLVWHLGVLLVSAELGAFCGWRSTLTRAIHEETASKGT